jgi:Amt family ammonium transporter
VHLVNGVWGTLSLGLFASGEFSAIGSDPIAPDLSSKLTGLFYGGGSKVLVAQAIGSGITLVATLGVAFAVMYAIDAVGYLRLSEEGEHDGLDLHEHGISAYPEYVISALASPAGAPLKVPVSGQR